MPGWHEATQELRDQGKIKMLGIIQEQHPDRTRLFMQWKRMDWPILVDSLNLLEVSVVPMTLLLDEHGIVRSIRPQPEDLAGFIEQEYAAPEDFPRAELPDPAKLRALAKDAESWRAYADATVLWQGSSQEAIDAYGKALQARPDDGRTHFRLGVAYRKRYDSADRQTGDFENAVRHWTRALEIDPNQYIWRRRIQQYGPRLDKPYSFYDWVHEARSDIRARGETPAPLSVEPSGAEFAHPMETFESAGGEAEPDPGGRILRDEKDFVRTEIAVVPAVIASGEPLRVHLTFRPNTDLKAHWNNEVEDLKVWVHSADGWQIDQRLLTAPNPPQPVSQEVRTIELELQSPKGVSGTVTIPAYALYYVCEDRDGVCLYRRQDVPIQVQLK